MLEFNNLLVVINTTSDTQLALEKAALIAGSSGRITALLPAASSTAEHLDSVETHLQSLREQGLDVTLNRSREKDVLRALLICQHEQQFDLTLKEPEPTSLSDSLFTSPDWKLLRSNSTPVLMVRPGNDRPAAPILAAVEAQPADREHLELSHQILKLSRDIAQRLDSDLHLFSAAPAPMQDPMHPDSNPQQQAQDYRQACLGLADRYGIPAEQVHIGQGPAELLIPEQTRRIGARLLVLGTVARSGLRGVLLGNTAEQILERVDTHVLVIPPLRNTG